MSVRRCSLAKRGDIVVVAVPGSRLVVEDTTHLFEKRLERGNVCLMSGEVVVDVGVCFPVGRCSEDGRMSMVSQSASVNEWQLCGQVSRSRRRGIIA